MTRKEFESKSFEEVMEQLNEECDDVTTIDILKDFIKRKVDSEDFYLVIHLCDAIWNDPDSSNSDWYIIDECDDEEGNPTCWCAEINHPKYGKYVWINDMGDHYNVEVICDGFTNSFTELVRCKSLTSAKRWVTRYLR